MRERTETMTDRERIEALLRREKPDRVPLWPFGSSGYSAINAGYTIADAYNNPSKALDSQRWCSEQYGWVCTPAISYASFGGWEFGGEIDWPTGEFDQAPKVLKHGVQTEDDVWKLNIPDPKTAGMIPAMKAFCQLSSKAQIEYEPFNVRAPGAGGAFTVAGNIAGVENLLRWMLKKPDVAHRLLRMATDYLIALGHYWKETFGVEKVLASGGDPSSSNQLISPKHFKEFALPYNREVNEKLLEMGYKHIYVHICGEQNRNLPYWAEIPMGDPGFVSFGHEVDIETAAEYFPRDVIIGNIEPAVIQTETPQEVYELARDVIENGKKCPGGFALSPGCGLPPKAPPYNVWMMTKAVNDFGWYD
jgi:uroporphyrinogen decarboxylase